MRFAARAGVIVGGLVVTVVLAGCGSSNSSGTLLSQEAASQLTDELNQASRALSDYNCTVAASAITAYQDDVAQLQGVNSTVLQMLSAGASTVRSLAQQKCPTATSTTTSTKTNTTTSTTTTTPTVTTNTATTSTISTSPSSGGATPTTATVPNPVTPTTETAVTPTTETQPNSGGAGLGGGNTGNTGDVQ